MTCSASPSDLRQMRICFANELSLLSKQKSVWAMFLLLPAIPIFYLALESLSPGSFPDTDVANIYASRVLAALPIVSMLFASAVCGSIVPADMGGRTACLVLPLPVSRGTIFMGNFLAGIAVCLAAVCGAYGIAAAIASAHSAQFYAACFMQSLAVALAGTLFFGSFAYALGIRVRKGSSILPLALLSAVIPALFLTAVIACPAMSAAIGLVPTFAPDLSLDMLGGSLHASLLGVLSGYSVLALSFEWTGPWAMAFSSVLLSAAALAIGGRMYGRRDERRPRLFSCWQSRFCSCRRLLPPSRIRRPPPMCWPRMAVSGTALPSLWTHPTWTEATAGRIRRRIPMTLRSPLTSAGTSQNLACPRLPSRKGKHTSCSSKAVPCSIAFPMG